MGAATNHGADPVPQILKEILEVSEDVSQRMVEQIVEDCGDGPDHSPGAHLGVCEQILDSSVSHVVGSHLGADAM